MASRGPDANGVWISDDRMVGLAHCRLSIIDLSENGSQPMVYQNRWSITYNGELYNYLEIKKELEDAGFAFRGGSDTEVVLVAYVKWGVDCLSRFNGMFAFAIYDQQEQRFFLARDHQGIKPLYYHCSERLFAFASRLSPLLVHSDISRDIDEQALSYYLEVGFVPHDNSIFKSLKKLSPGHFLTIDRDRHVSVERYYQPSLDEVCVEQRSSHSWVDALEGKISQSVKRQMVADVPIGVFLSGGIDSSVVAAMMQQHSSAPIHSFCVGFDQDGYDESFHSRNVAEYLGTNHHEIRFSPDALIGLLDEYTQHYDEPFADWSALPMMAVSRFARETVTVCLGGDGGDELFGGYKYYRYLKLMEPILRLPVGLRSCLVNEFLKKINVRHKHRLLLKALSEEDAVKCFGFMRSMIKDYSLTSLLNFESQQRLAELFGERLELSAGYDVLSWSGRIDSDIYLVDDILQKVDVASMAFSLESRVPLLDREVVDFATAVPSQLKIRGNVTKWILREVLYRHVPRAIVDRPKAGFNVPIREWFRGELKELLLDELSQSRVRQFGYIETDGVQVLINKHLDGAMDTHPMLWVLMSLLRWHTSVRDVPRYNQ